MNSIGNGSLVVARFADGRVLKGTTHDFAPHKPVFHLMAWDAPTARALAIPVGELKALFFVRTYAGDPKHVDAGDLDTAKGQGRRVVVTFSDGEVIRGFTTGYSRDKQGFFVIPVDPKSNNSRVFAVIAAVKSVVWADAPAAMRAGG